MRALQLHCHSLLLSKVDIILVYLCYLMNIMSVFPLQNSIFMGS